jgi:predicted DCC family thiol-disulfide oxidoreductase YuxK
VARLGLLVPRPLRDLAYRVIARNRYAWFGRRTRCRVPSAGEAGRLLD